MAELDARYLLECQAPGGSQASVACDDAVFLVEKDRIREPELLDILAAIWAICSSEWVLGFLANGDRVDPDKPCPTIQKSQPRSSTTGLIHPYEVRHLTISEIKLLSSFPAGFKLEGSFHEKWARIGNSVPPLLMKAIADHARLFRKTQRL